MGHLRKRDRSSSRPATKKRVAKYISRVLNKGSVEVGILRELVLCRFFSDSARAMNNFATLLEKAVLDQQVDNSESNLTIANCNGAVHVRIRKKTQPKYARYGLDVSRRPDWPGAIEPSRQVREISAGARDTNRTDCEPLCRWATNKLRKHGEPIPVKAFRDFFGDYMKSVTVTRALGCLESCPSIRVTAGEHGTPMFSLDESEDA